MYRYLVKDLKPIEDPRPESQKRYRELTEAYNRIMLHRMHEGGVPMPYTRVYRASKSNSLMVNEFLEENNFFTPYVPIHYTKYLFGFWVVFGVCHWFIEYWDPYDVYSKK